MSCWNGSSKDLTHKLWYNSLSQEQSKPPPLWRNFTQRPLRSREATAASHHSEEDLNHPMEEVAITTTPMVWMWIMLSLVEWAHHMHENHCSICHKEGCSTRNHPGYNQNHPIGSWCNNSKPSQTTHTRVISTTPHLTPTQDPLDAFLKNITKTQRCDQVLHTLRSTFDMSLNEQGNLLADKQPAVKEWDKSAKVLTVEATPCISLPDHHMSF